MPTQKMVVQSFEISPRATFVPDESRPDESYFFFSYKIRIINHGSEPAQLLSRHWIIVDGEGNKEEVRGAGVKGLQPKIQPGQTFEYESGCPLSTLSGSMRGSYHMRLDSGDVFEVEIPEFYLIAPMALH